MRLELMLLAWLAGSEPPTAPDHLPSPELLEFLGQFEDADGDWVDPFSLEDPLRELIDEDDDGKDPVENDGPIADPATPADAERDRNGSA